MFNFDIPTLRLIGLILVSSSSISLVLFLFWRSKTIRQGAQFWVLGSVVYTFAYILAALLETLPTSTHYSLIFDISLVSSGLLFLHGTCVTLQKPSLLKYELLITVLTSCLCGYFVYIEPNFLIRISIDSIITAGIALWTSYILLVDNARKRQPPVLASAIVFIIYAFYNLVKIAYIAVAEQANSDALTISFLSSSLFVCAISLTFILMAYYTLEHELIELIGTIKNDSKLRLHDIEERWRLALEYSNAGAWEWNLTNLSMSVSSQWKKMAGYSDNEMTGELQHEDILIHPDDKEQVIKVLADLQSGETTIFEDEHRIARKDGSWLWVLSRGRVIQFSEDNIPLKAIGTDTDISLQKNNEDVLKTAIDETRKSQETADLANRAKTTFLTNMSHEIRTPMNAILGFSQLLIGEPNLSSSQIESLAIINKSGEHLLSLINDILDLSRIESGNFTLQVDKTPLLELLGDVSNFFSNRPIKEYVSFKLDFSSSLPAFILSDPKALRQILTNLLANAFKFTNAGKVIFKVKATSITPSSSTLLVSVSDTGVGIAPEDYHLIFSAFEQTEVGMLAAEGSGLGLAISKNLATLMGGKLNFTSELGRGSCFTLELPITVINEHKNTAVSSINKKILRLAKSGVRLLIVDDIESNRLLLKHQLGNLGFEIMEAGSADKALQLVKDWNPEIILMDLKMPGMRGDEAIKEIRKYPNHSSLPIIVVTANVLEGEKERLMSLGATDYISKPFRRDEILEKIATVLNTDFIYEQEPTTRSAAININTLIPNPEHIRPQPQIKILVVDDNYANQQLLQSQLQSLGYTADVACNGKQALQMWQAQNYALIFSDCAMPIMDGFEMSTLLRAEEIERKLEQRTVIIAITGSPDEYKNQCQQSGMDHILGKPLLIKALKLALTDHLKQD